jgi:hypothetical protein
MTELPFDTIRVQEWDGERTMDVRQFMELDLAMRVRLVMTGSLRFFCGDVQVPQREALGALQKVSAARK